MSGRHYVTPEQRLFVEERADDLAAAVPPNMVEGLRYMLQVSKGAGLSTVDAYASVMEALRAIQKPHKPQEKAWLALEAGIRWLEREQAKENT